MISLGGRNYYIPPGIEQTEFTPEKAEYEKLFESELGKLKQVDHQRTKIYLQISGLKELEYTPKLVNEIIGIFDEYIKKFDEIDIMYTRLLETFAENYTTYSENLRQVQYVDAHNLKSMQNRDRLQLDRAKRDLDKWKSLYAKLSQPTPQQTSPAIEKMRHVERIQQEFMQRDAAALKSLQDANYAWMVAQAAQIESNRILQQAHEAHEAARQLTNSAMYKYIEAYRSGGVADAEPLKSLWTQAVQAEKVSKADYDQKAKIAAEAAKATQAALKFADGERMELVNIRWVNDKRLAKLYK
jgi:hypothetical protein